MLAKGAVTSVIPILLGLGPVFAFLAALILIDSFKLVRFRAVIQTIVIGAIVAVICYLVNSRLAASLPVTSEIFSRYVGPLVEELFKSMYLIFLIRSRRVGFMVDAAIYGFAIGAGFAFVENLYYWHALTSAPMGAWVVRGFGTAVMHGGATAIFGIVARVLADRWGDRNPAILLPGLALAIGLHSLFNHFILPPVLSAAAMMVVFPTVVAYVFYRSERSTQGWLGTGLDSDLELLDLITSGRISDSHVGTYLENLRHRFPDVVVVDMLCYMRLNLELSLQAKGVLMMRQANLSYSIDPELKEQLAELRYLEKHIGVTGKLAIAPFLKTSSRDLWQIYMLVEDGKSA